MAPAAPPEAGAEPGSSRSRTEDRSSPIPTLRATWRCRAIRRRSGSLFIDDDSGLLDGDGSTFPHCVAARAADLRARPRPARRDAAGRARRQPGAHRARLHRADRARMPGLALLVVAEPAARRRIGFAACVAAPTTGSRSPAIRRSWSRGSRPCCAAAGPASCRSKRRRSPPASSRSGRTASTRMPARSRPALSRKEYELLRQLARADGRVLEREHIYQRVWGYTMVRGDRSVDVFVRKLRTKLERISPGVALRAHPLRRRIPVRARARRRGSGGVRDRQPRASARLGSGAHPLSAPLLNTIRNVS